jgi:hypothetical protein
MANFCGNCGSPLNSAAVFCGSCGTRIAESAPAPLAATPAPTAPPGSGFAAVPAAFTPAPITQSDAGFTSVPASFPATPVTSDPAEFISVPATFTPAPITQSDAGFTSVPASFPATGATAEPGFTSLPPSYVPPPVAAIPPPVIPVPVSAPNPLGYAPVGNDPGPTSVPYTQTVGVYPPPAPAYPTMQTAAAPAGAYPARKSNTLLKLIVAFVLLLFVLGALALAGLWYAAQKIKAKSKAHTVTTQVRFDPAAPDWQNTHTLEVSGWPRSRV